MKNTRAREICPRCRRKVGTQARFCPDCGASLGGFSRILAFAPAALEGAFVACFGVLACQLVGALTENWESWSIRLGWYLSLINDLLIYQLPLFTAAGAAYAVKKTEGASTRAREAVLLFVGLSTAIAQATVMYSQSGPLETVGCAVILLVAARLGGLLWRSLNLIWSRIAPWSATGRLRLFSYVPFLEIALLLLPLVTLWVLLGVAVVRIIADVFRSGKRNHIVQEGGAS